MAPVVHETLEILEKHVLVFVQKALDGISVIDVEGESESNQEKLAKSSSRGKREALLQSTVSEK